MIYFRSFPNWIIPAEIDDDYMCLNFMQINNAGISGFEFNQEALLAANSLGDFAATFVSIDFNNLD